MPSFRYTRARFASTVWREGTRVRRSACSSSRSPRAQRPAALSASAHPLPYGACRCARAPSGRVLLTAGLRSPRRSQAHPGGPPSTRVCVCSAAQAALFVSRVLASSRCPRRAHCRACSLVLQARSARTDGSQRSFAGLVHRELAVEPGQLERAALGSHWAGNGELASGVVQAPVGVQQKGDS